MLHKAADLGIEHAERELSMRPQTFARRKPIAQAIATALDEYSKSRAFWITGIVKEEVLEKVRNYILWYTKMYPQYPVPGDQFTNNLKAIIEDYLPKGANTAARAALIARNNVSDLYNYARYATFTSPALQGWVVAFMYSAIMDSRTTILCRSLNGRIFTKEDLQKSGLIPPNHHNCRSVLLPIQKNEDWYSSYTGQKPLRKNQKPQDGF